jgi:hypothetical protein
VDGLLNLEQSDAARDNLESILGDAKSQLQDLDVLKEGLVRIHSTSPSPATDWEDLDPNDRNAFNEASGFIEVSEDFDGFETRLRERLVELNATHHSPEENAQTDIEIVVTPASPTTSVSEEEDLDAVWAATTPSEDESSGTEALGFLKDLEVDLHKEINKLEALEKETAKEERRREIAETLRQIEEDEPESWDSE